MVGAGRVFRTGSGQPSDGPAPASPATITGTPAAGRAGTHYIAIAAKNSSGISIQLLTIVVT